MSVYGPKINLPKIQMPSMPEISGKTLGVLAIIIIVAIVIATIVLTMPSLPNLFNNHINVSWKNNPLDLKSNLAKAAELTLTLTNNTETKQNITMNVSTESEEIIVFCPYNTFENVEPKNSRQITCIVRRNPSGSIFTGNYTLTITTTLGEAKTTLDVVA